MARRKGYSEAEGLKSILGLNKRRRKPRVSEEVAELRKEVAKRRRAVTNKISRIRRTSGMNVGGTEYDPRKDRGAHNKMNARQLRAYIRKLDQFQSRETKFVRGAENQPISVQDWNKYLKIQEKANEFAKRRKARIGKVKTPTGMTIEERENTLYGEEPRKTADGNIINSPFPAFNRKPENINGPDALRKISEQTRKTYSREYINKNMQNWRAGAQKMMVELGHSELIESLNGLSDRQFEVLWSAGFAQRLSPIYYAVKTHNRGRERSFVDDAGEAQAEEIKQFLDWAHTLRK